MKYFKNKMDPVKDSERGCESWDDNGLSLYMTVLCNDNLDYNTIAMSSEWWSRNHIINTPLGLEQVWKVIVDVANLIGRSLVVDIQKNVVYINKLSEKQTEEIVKIFKSKFENFWTVWELEWDIEHAKLPE